VLLNDVSNVPNNQVMHYQVTFRFSLDFASRMKFALVLVPDLRRSVCGQCEWSSPIDSELAPSPPASGSRLDRRVVTAPNPLPPFVSFIRLPSTGRAGR